MKFKGGPAGSIVVTFDEPEVGLLREVPRQLRMLYESDTDDPARERLFATRAALRAVEASLAGPTPPVNMLRGR